MPEELNTHVGVLSFKFYLRKYDKLTMDSTIIPKMQKLKENLFQLPTITTAILIGGFFSIWLFQSQREKSYQKDAVTAEAERVELEINETLNQTSRALQRYSSRVEFLGVGNKEFLDLDSQAYLEQLPILKRIGLIDKKNQVYWSYPHEISNQVRNFNQSENPDRFAALEQARITHKPSLSKAIELKSGGLGFLLPVALYPKGKFAGFVYATVQADKLFHSFTSTQDFQVSIYESGNLIFTSKSKDHLVSDLTARHEMTLEKSQWLVEVTPTEKFIAAGQSLLPSYILLFGTLMSLAIGGLLQKLSVARREAQLNVDGVKLLNLRLGVALDAAKMGVWNLDLKTKKIWRSKNHDEVFGYSSPLSTWDQTTFYDRVVPEDRDRVSQEFNLTLKNRSSSVEFRIQRADNNAVHWLCVMSQLTFDDNHNPIQMIGVVRDITAEKENAIERQTSLEWKKALINSSNYAIISTDAQGTIKSFNNAATHMLGYSSEEIIDKATPKIFHVKEESIARAETLTKELGRFIEPGFDAFTAKAKILRIADENEWTFVRKDRTRFPANLSVTAFYNDAGEVLGYLGICLDLTEKKKAQEQLAAANDRLKRVVEATEEGVWEREYIPGGKIRFLDSQAKRIYGFQPSDEPAYEQIVARIAPEDRALVGEALKNHFENKTSGFEIEFRMTTKTDLSHHSWIRARGKIVEDASGGVPLLVSTVQDVTDELEKREQLKAALIAAEDATKAKSDFLANMSHEIRTPINGVIGMTGLLLDAELGTTERGYAETVRSSAEILLNLINDILDFSKIEARKLDLECIDFDLDNVTLNIQRLLDFSAKKKGIELVRTLSADLPTTIFKGDPNRIAQILTNLISNAVKFTERGQVSMAISHDSRDFEGKTVDHKIVILRIEITDTGIGMSESALARMFQPFNQADASTSRRFGGTGLGLSICKHLSEMMGGQIGVRSKEGAGSTFWFTLVLQKGERSNLQVTNESKTVVIDRAQRKIRVLLAEDNMVNQVIGRKMLEKYGFHVDVVANGNEAIDALNSVPYDLILMDCQMPELDGYETSIKIRTSKQKKYCNIPIIAMTANAMSGDREKCLEAGMNDYVTKPIRADDLASVVQRVFRNVSDPSSQAG